MQCIYNQGHRKSFFMGGELSKNVNYNGWPTAKNLKLHWLKSPKTVPKKRNFDQKINDSKLHVWSLSSKFSSRKSQSQQKIAVFSL